VPKKSTLSNPHGFGNVRGRYFSRAALGREPNHGGDDFCLA